MQLYINCISADRIMKCKKDTQEVLQHIKLINPQYMEGDILFDVAVTLPDNFSISSRFEGLDEFVTISLSNLGNIDLNVKDFRDLVLY